MAQEPQHPQQNQQRQAQQQERPPGEGAQPGDRVANPAQPMVQTTVPERPDASAFKPKDEPERKPPLEYPKMRYHPVHGGVTVKNAEDETYLQPKTDWFDTAELADLARTHTEAEAARTYNQMRKVRAMEEGGLPVVSNSVQSDEAIRAARTEPL